jgi:anti-sigma factor RsiW
MLRVGGLGGWQVRDASLARVDLPMADAVQAHRLFAGSEAWISRPVIQAVARLAGRHFSRVGQLPDLAGYGFKPVGARLLSNEQGPAALLVFEDGKGQRISLFLRSPGEQYRRMPDGQRVDGQLEARYWSHGAYNFALVSAADDVRGAGWEALRLGCE